MIELWTITGYALIPFVLGLVFAANDYCGSRVVPWTVDLVVVAASVGLCLAVRSVLENTFAETEMGALGTLVAAMAGLVSMFITLPLVYKVAYSMTRPVATPAH